MATTSAQVVTAEEFLSLPEERGAYSYELRHGEIVKMTRPKFKHALLQRRLRILLEQMAPEGSYVDVEVAFRPLAEYELWSADVAYLAAARFAAVDTEGNIAGAPDLVVEVLSASNTVEEMNERERICLDNGAQQFWTVDGKRREVKVSTPDGHTVSYRAGDAIEIFFAPGTTIAIDAIFDSKL